MNIKQPIDNEARLQTVEKIGINNNPYMLVIKLLKYELEHGITEAQFLKDYLFVIEKIKNGRIRGRWYKWVGYKWREINVIELIEELDGYVHTKIEQLFDAFNRELATVSNEEERKEITKRYERAIRKLATCLSSGNTRVKLLKTLKKNGEIDGFKIPKDQLDNHDLMINTLTHLLVYDKNSKTFKAIKHGEETKKYYPTKVMNVNYDPNARCEKFIRFLYKIMLGDNQLVRFLIIMLGACILKGNDITIGFFGYGRNGKSTLQNVIWEIFNDYIYDANMLDHVDTELVVFGKKQRKKLGKFIAIPFQYSIPYDKMIPDYHLELLKERKGIFNLLLAGLDEYLNIEDISDIMSPLKKRYVYGIEVKERTYHIKEFIARYLERADGVSTPFNIIYNKYEEFCRLKGINKLSQKHVSRLLEKEGFASKIIHKTTYKVDCKIKDKPLVDDIKDSPLNHILYYR